MSAFDRFPDNIGTLLTAADDPKLTSTKPRRNSKHVPSGQRHAPKEAPACLEVSGWFQQRPWNVGIHLPRTKGPDYTEFLRSWQQFLNCIEPGDEVAFFYAGQGVAVPTNTEGPLNSQARAPIYRLPMEGRVPYR
jgi:hypothetical protein